MAPVLQNELGAAHVAKYQPLLNNPISLSHTVLHATHGRRTYNSSDERRHGIDLADGSTRRPKVS